MLIDMFYHITAFLHQDFLLYSNMSLYIEKENGKNMIDEAGYF